MEAENRNLNGLTESRRHAVAESLGPISAAELSALTEELFPSVDHPWLGKFAEVVNDPTSGTFHHAMADDHVHVLYCHDKNIGMWFIRGSGKGRLQPEHLAIGQGNVHGTS